MGVTTDIELLKEFERRLNPRHPEESEIPARVLGYGEISTVFEIGTDDQKNLAYKRMPIFNDDSELRAYESVFNDYNRLLSEDVGLKLPAQGYASVPSGAGKPVMFLAQEKLDPSSIGNSAIHVLRADDTILLVRQVLRELARVWRFNVSQSKYEIGIDGQVSNWSIVGFDPSSPRLEGDIELIYFDTSTPLFRVDGAEQLDVELFLRSAASFLVPILNRLFLDDVVGRYYDFHLVATDLIANFYKEQLPGLIGALIEATNDLLESEAGDLGVAPVTAKEVKSYYREDALIWRLYLGSRRLDRFLRTAILRGEYPYILPGKIKR